MLLFAVPLAHAADPTCPGVPIHGDGSYDAPVDVPAGDGRFDWPVGPPDGQGWFDVQPFGQNRHLGADLNAVGGTHIGAPVTAVADGCVVFAQDIWRGWGRVVRVLHRLPDGSTVETLYAHLDRMDVTVGTWVARGAPVGTVGDAHHTYGPHLHLELRTTVGLPQGGGYGHVPGYVDPIQFIAVHRGIPPEPVAVEAAALPAQP
jgi:murein DD-endopeptidase MepM/ murein hydrolase activator NlpD